MSFTSSSFPSCDDDAVRAAIIGCGEHIVQSHLFPDLPHIDFVGAFDYSEANIKRAEEHLGRALVAYPSQASLLADDNVDAVFIGTPDQYHASILLASVRAGKHVFCEKPLATLESDLETVREALDIAERDHLVVSSCHPLRTEPLIRQARSFVANQDRLGRPLHFSFEFSFVRRSLEPSLSCWR